MQRSTQSDLAETTREVTQLLRKQIVRGERIPGAPLVERRLCADIGVSRTPVREALQRLQEEGLVEPRGRRGLSVSKLSSHEARELYELIGVLERHAVTTATSISKKELAHLTALHSTMRKTSDDLEGYMRLDEEFHAALIAPAGRRTAHAMIEKLKARAERYEWTYFRDTRSFATSIREHATVLRSLKVSDFEKAGEIVERHWLNCLDRLLTEMR